MKLVSVFLSAALMFSTSAFAVTTNYFVPVSEPALAPLAKFKVELECSTENGLLQLKYNYPIELTGVPNQISFRQSRFDPSMFFGPQGEMKCDRDCSVHHVGLEFNEDALRRILGEVSKDKSEFNLRLNLALQNQGDPGGVFSGTPQIYCAN